MNKNTLLVLVLIFAATMLIGCAPNQSADVNSVEKEGGSVLWLTPLSITETQDPASIGTPSVFIYPYSIERLAEHDFGPVIDAGDLVIATPLFPNFVINSTKLFACEGKVYMVIEVTNRGPYNFQYISLGISHGTDWVGVTRDEEPWVPDGSACPVDSIAPKSSLPVGASAWIYQEVHPNPAYTDYSIHLSMCAYMDAPSPCPYRYHLHTEAWPTPTPTSEIMRALFIELYEVDLCWVGPGPLYEVVNSIPGDTEVELLGIGDVEGFLVVLEPKYQRPCWVMERFLKNPVPEEVKIGLKVFISPLLPSATVGPGSVSGRAFKDNDGSGDYNSGDQGIPGVTISLAPGGCNNPGQASSTTTNNNGRYSFGSVSPGRYCLIAVKPTSCKIFSTPSQYEITVPGDTNVERDFGFRGCS